MAKKKLYDDMSPEEREHIVRQLMDAGGSNRSVAAALGTTRGTIARLRRTKNIPSKNKPGFADVIKSESGVAVARPVPKIPRPKKAKQQKPVPDMPGLVEAKSEASRCEHRGAYCPYEAVVGSPFCPLHQD